MPGVQSQEFPDAPKGILFPGDPGIGAGIAQGYRTAFMPRVGLAWDPTGTQRWSVRASYGIFYDPFSNGTNITGQSPLSSLPWAQFYQLTGPSVNFSDPYHGQPSPQPNTFLHPSTMVVLDSTARPPYAQD